MSLETEFRALMGRMRDSALPPAPDSGAGKPLSCQDLLQDLLQAMRERFGANDADTGAGAGAEDETDHEP